MTTFTESRHAGEFILSEANGSRSRDNVTVLAGQGVLKAGSVLGKITVSGKYKLVTAGASDGSQNAAAILIAPTDTSNGDVVAAVIARAAEINKNLLTYGSDIDTAGEITTVLTALAGAGIGIIAR